MKRERSGIQISKSKSSARPCIKNLYIFQTIWANKKGKSQKFFKQFEQIRRGNHKIFPSLRLGTPKENRSRFYSTFHWHIMLKRSSCDVRESSTHRATLVILKINKRSFSGCLLTWRHRHNISLPDAQNWKSSIERPSKNRGYLPVAPLEYPNQPGNRCCYNIEPSQKCWVFGQRNSLCLVHNL